MLTSPTINFIQEVELGTATKYRKFQQFLLRHWRNHYFQIYSFWFLLYNKGHICQSLNLTQKQEKQLFYEVNQNISRKEVKKREANILCKTWCGSQELRPYPLGGGGSRINSSKPNERLCLQNKQRPSYLCYFWGK